MPPEVFALQEGPLAVVPICHYRMEFAVWVRRAIRELSPTIVAVELPPSLRTAMLEAVGRFPYLSWLVADTDSEERNLLLPVEPTDPFAEALRTARELGLQVEFVDQETDTYPSLYDPMPDSSSLTSIGLEAYWKAYRETVADRPRVALDAEREAFMADRLLHLTRSGGRVLLVCGMAHAAGVLEAFRSGEPRPGAPARSRSVKIYEPDLDTIRQSSSEMPLVMALYELVRGGPGPAEVWVNPEPDEPEPPPEPPPTQLDSLSPDLLVSGLEAMLGIATADEDEPIDPEVKKVINDYLASLPEMRLTVANLMNFEPAAPRLESAPQAHNPAPRAHRFRQVPERRDQLLEHYQAINAEARQQAGGLDRQQVLVGLWRRAADYYQENTGETMLRWQFDVMAQFARNYARLTGQLLPGLFQLVMAARGVSDDNFAYEVWDLGSFYPWSESGALESIRITPDELFLGGVKIHRWSFHRRFPRMRRVRVPVKQRHREHEPGEWEKDFQRGHICSYPPEDVVIEDYGRYLQKKAITMLSEERTRVEPFSTSLLDGIDMRETIRNWADGHKIFVREVQRVRGGAGSVVVIFDEDADDRRYPWKMTWHGEHSQESDMAFFATPPSAKIVGPGIARCEYGGMMLSYPPRRMADVWSDPFYRPCQSKAEVLLMSAIDYSEETHVVYVAAKAPRSFFRTFAARLGKKLVYMPIGQLSPVSLKKLRVFHVLSGHRLRKIAKDYIW